MLTTRSAPEWFFGLLALAVGTVTLPGVHQGHPDPAGGGENPVGGFGTACTPVIGRPAVANLVHDSNIGALCYALRNRC